MRLPVLILALSLTSCKFFGGSSADERASPAEIRGLVRELLASSGVAEGYDSLKQNMAQSSTALLGMVERQAATSLSSDAIKQAVDEQSKAMDDFAAQNYLNSCLTTRIGRARLVEQLRDAVDFSKSNSDVLNILSSAKIKTALQETAQSYRDTTIDEFKVLLEKGGIDPGVFQIVEQLQKHLEGANYVLQSMMKAQKLGLDWLKTKAPEEYERLTSTFEEFRAHLDQEQLKSPYLLAHAIQGDKLMREQFEKLADHMTKLSAFYETQQECFKFYAQGVIESGMMALSESLEKKL